MAARGQRRVSICQLSRGVILRRVVVTVVVGALVVAAELDATLSPAAVHQPAHHRLTVMVRSESRKSEPGEPVLLSASIVPSSARTAADTFVSDYALWRNDRVATVPGRDTTPRVLGLLEHAGRLGYVDAAHAVASVRIARAPRGTYVVTSVIGNFLVGRRGFRWLVISLPGD